LTLPAPLNTFTLLMRRGFAHLFTALAILLAVQPARLPAQAPGSGDGPSPEEYLRVGQEEEDNARIESAIGTYRALVKKHPLSPEAATAQFRLAQLLDGQGDLRRAFDAYQTLLTKYPDTPHFERAVASQVTIANHYLQATGTRILGVAISNPAERAAEMYQKILGNAPFSKFAPVAQFNLGLAYERQRKAMDAIAAYQKVLDTYPNSDVCDDALYQIGFVWLRVGFGSGSQDLSALIEAKNTFEDFLIEYPNSEKASQARDNLNLIAGRESGDIYRIARFYERYKDLKAAFIYYNDVIRRQPQTKAAEIARARIEELRSEYGEEALVPGPERPETGEKLAVRRRLQAQVETSALADYTGPPKRDIVPDELPAPRPRMRTSLDDMRPLPAVEPDLPTIE
jgi:outer membrane protein assembly factor BamD